MKKAVILFLALILSASVYAENPFKLYQSGGKKWKKTGGGGSGKKVFANSSKISSKTSNGKSIAAFPDVCLTPPSSPTGPGSMGYPNFSDADDNKGSKSVKNDLNNQQNSYKETWYYRSNPLKAFNDKLKSKSGRLSIRERYNIKYLQKNK